MGHQPARTANGTGGIRRRANRYGPCFRGSDSWGYLGLLGVECQGQSPDLRYVFRDPLHIRDLNTEGVIIKSGISLLDPQNRVGLDIAETRTF